jgi:hypothetical protein
LPQAHRVCELSQLVQCGQLLGTRETDALHVLDQPEPKQVFVSRVSLNGPDRLQARALVGAPAAFAANQLIHADVTIAPDEHGLKLAPRLDRACQFVECVFVEVPARIRWVGSD